MTNPIFAYDHSAGCTAITGGAFVPAGIWPREYDGSYLYQDLVCGKIFRLVPAGGGAYTAADFVTGITSYPISMTFGPYGSTQALYYIAWNDGDTNDQIRRLVYTGLANRAPVARATADPDYGPTPLDVDFDGSTSSDPDNDPLTYDWDFGDGSAHSTSATVTHTYTTIGTYTATLTAATRRPGG